MQLSILCLFSLLQYQILINSVFMLLGCPLPRLGADRNSHSTVHLMSNDPSTEEGSGGQLPRSHKDRISQGPGVDIDKLTGKRIIHASDREDLYLPGRILHITARKEKRYILLMISYEHWDYLESAIVLRCVLMSC